MKGTTMLGLSLVLASAASFAQTKAGEVALMPLFEAGRTWTYQLSCETSPAPGYPEDEEADHGSDKGPATCAVARAATFGDVSVAEVTCKHEVKHCECQGAAPDSRIYALSGKGLFVLEEFPATKSAANAALGKAVTAKPATKPKGKTGYPPFRLSDGKEVKTACFTWPGIQACFAAGPGPVSVTLEDDVGQYSCAQEATLEKTSQAKGSP